MHYQHSVNLGADITVIRLYIHYTTLYKVLYCYTTEQMATLSTKRGDIALDH
jgi:hypothetical protein